MVNENLLGWNYQLKSHLSVKNPNTEITLTVIFKALPWRAFLSHTSIKKLKGTSTKFSRVPQWLPVQQMAQAELSGLFLALTLLSAPSCPASKCSLCYPRSCTPKVTRTCLGDRTPAAFLAGIPWQDPCRNEEHDRATETAHEAGLPSRQPGAKGGKLILRRDGSTFLRQHPTAAAVTPWSTPLALQTLTEQEIAGVEKGKQHRHHESLPCVWGSSPTCHVQRAEGSLTNFLQREKFVYVWGWKQGRLFQHYSKLIPRAQVLFWHGSPWKLYMHSSLCRSFKLMVFKWTILVLARSSRSTDRNGTTDFFSVRYPLFQLYRWCPWILLLHPNKPNYPGL